MTDIPLVLSSDSTSLDWCDPSLLAQPLDDSNDIQSYILMLLCTDRVAPEFHYGLQPSQRRGSWHDSYVGEFGSLFWLGTEQNQWSQGSKIAQVQRWAEMALQPLYDERMIQSPAQITADWVSAEAVQIIVSTTAANGQQRTITYVIPSM